MAQKKSDILESLISQLEKKQADISCFLDLIDDYMALYDIKKKLKTDIKKRGVSYEAQSASGKATIIKQNQSVKDLVAVNKQMLMILDKLGLTTEKTIRDDDDDKLWSTNRSLHGGSGDRKSGGVQRCQGTDETCQKMF